MPCSGSVDSRRRNGERNALGGALTFGDPVAEWTAAVLARVAGGAPRVRLRVTAGFLLVAAIVGSVRGVMGSVMTVALLGSVILVHELPRAAFGCALGRSSAVRISAAGGDTELAGAPLQGAAAAAFAVLGSAANLLVALALFSVARRDDTWRSAWPAQSLAFAHGAWGAAQLLPVVPFRAGAAVSERLPPALRFAHATCSAVLVVALGAVTLIRTPAPALLGVLLLVTMACGSSVRAAHRELCDSAAGVDAIVEQAETELSRGASDRGRDLAQRGLGEARSPRRRQRLLRALAWAGIGKNDPFLAHGALLELPTQAMDVHLLGSYLGCCNRLGDAIEFLERARHLGHRSPESTKLLADLLFRRGERGAVLALTLEDDGLLSVEDRRAIEAAVAAGG